jgi:hypothetical protein
MKIGCAIFLVALAFVIGSISAIAGALMLTSGNPTRGNWISFYALSFGVPLALLVATIYALIRMFR